ncbi:hypothetical protein G6011_11617 [Alternaria panax]|uniref:BTB domain-containing protein n=1 Tax=Alternaria panax TaxID=48097 RepID=A0AAD4IE77_9PLEO|nr:hypothetical protein G6011_11617 [Alternaria panax]
MNSRIPRPTSPSAGEQRLAQADVMLPSSPLAEMQKNRDPRNTLLAPMFRTDSQGPRVYRSAATSHKGIPLLPVTMKIIVGSDPANQRTWVLPKAVLSRHSDIFQSIITADDTVSEVHLPTISPNAFADFVSYTHSSIYSTNTQVAGYRSIRAHADVCLLAAKLEADEYWEAGMRKLYDLFLPLARSRRSDAKQSFIRAGDIAYICNNTTDENLKGVVTINAKPLASNNPLNSQTNPIAEDSSSSAPLTPPRKGYHSHDVGAMKGLRTLFFDALASHWTQRDVIYIGAQNSPRGGGNNKNDVPGDSTTWRQVCHTYPEFHFHIAKTSGVLLGWRTSLLRHINIYLNPVGPQLVEEQRGGSSSGDVAIKEDDDNAETERIEDIDKFKVKIEEVESDEELEMESATRRPKLTLKLMGMTRTTGGDGIEYSGQASSNVTSENEEAIENEYDMLELGEVDAGVDSDGSTVVDGGSQGEEEAPEDDDYQEEDLMEGMDAGIEEQQPSAVPFHTIKPRPRSRY